MRKKRRATNRKEKAAKLAPRPLQKLRPSVRCPTVKYNTKVRLGRGFTALELKEAGIKIRYAPTIGIAFDKRRRSHSLTTHRNNVARLIEYQKRLLIFKKAKKTKSEAKGKTKADVKAVKDEKKEAESSKKKAAKSSEKATEKTTEKTTKKKKKSKRPENLRKVRIRKTVDRNEFRKIDQSTGTIIPLKKAKQVVAYQKITDDMKAFNAFKAMKVARFKQKKMLRYMKKHKIKQKKTKKPKKAF